MLLKVWSLSQQTRENLKLHLSKESLTREQNQSVIFPDDALSETAVSTEYEEIFMKL